VQHRSLAPAVFLATPGSSRATILRSKMLCVRCPCSN
jgi:hypothetical protein